MSSFTRFNAEVEVKLHTQACEELKGNYWVTTNSFTYFVGGLDTGKTVTVPKGYITDGASVPRPLWSIIPPWGKYGQAAILHDYLCDYGFIKDGKTTVRINRKEVDEIFYEALEVLAVNPKVIKAIKMGVDLYRFIFRPTTPNISDAKRRLEKDLNKEI